jgi:hypothetical protein
MDESRSEPKA